MPLWIRDDVRQVTSTRLLSVLEEILQAVAAGPALRGCGAPVGATRVADRPVRVLCFENFADNDGSFQFARIAGYRF